MRAPARRTGRPLAWLTALLLGLALVAAACGGGSSDEEGDGGGGEDSGADVDASACPVDALDSASGPVDVTVWHAYSGLTKTTIEEQAAAYNASQDKVKVSVEAQGTYEELLKKYEDALGDPSTLPDVVLTEDTTTQFMIDSQSVVPASACIEADPDAKAAYDDVIESVSAAYTVDGVLWPAAFSVSTPILYVNNAILAQANVDTTSYPQTLDELRSTAEQIKAANVPGLEAPLVMKLDSWFIEHWLTGVDQPIVNEDNGRAGLATGSEFANETTTELYEWLKGMIDDGLLKAIPSSAGGIDEYLAINNKSAAMLIQTSTAITTVSALLSGSVDADAVEAEAGGDISISTGLDINVGLVPGIEAAGQGQIGGSGWYLVDTGEDASIAGGWDYLQWFLQTPQQVEWTLKASYLPVLTSAAEDPTLQADFTTTTSGKWLNVAYQGLQNLNPEFPGPVIGPYKEFRSDVRASLDAVVLSGADIDTSIEDANTKFQTALDTYASEVGG